MDRIFMEDKCFHWATLRFSHSNSSNTVVKYPFTSSIRHMTWYNESNRVGQFFTSFFPASCIRRSVALHGDYFLHNSQCTLYCSAIIMLVQFQKPSQQIATYVQSNLNASNRQMHLGDLSHISKLSTLEIAPLPFYPAYLLDLEIIPRFLLM